MILTFTKTITDKVDSSDIRGTIRANQKAGYTLTHAEAPERGEYVGNCENCGLPIFENEKYNLDTEGVYWHEECPEGASNEK